ncbi:MAG TPA: hypothetical protein VMU14_10500 [Acidimicrobiales bacterium]|nr:hypothetical protein [Acidimicrobiales bacterium]
MNDDELIDRLRRTLQDEASRVEAPPGAWEEFERRAPAPRPSRRPWVLGAPVAALGIAAAVIALVAVNNPGAHKATNVQTPATAFSAPTSTAAGARAPGASASAGAAATPSTTPAPGATTYAPALAALQPQSVTFMSAQEGFVLGSSSIARTTDGGRSWSALPTPAGWDVRELRFANASDGWAWGAQLWSTHDGGRTWHRLVVPGGQGGVYALEAAAGTVHMVVFDGQAFRVATAPVASDAFTLSLGAPSVPVGGGPVPTIQLVLEGRTGWLVEVDRTVVGGLQLVGGQWQPWTPPCTGANGPAVLAASSPTELVAACDQGVWGPATPMGERLWVSHDGGATWTDSGGVPVTGPQAIATASPTVVVAGTEATFDGGATWSTVLPSGAEDDLGFTTTAQGVAIVQRALLMTRDSGHTWQEVRFSS